MAETSESPWKSRWEAFLKALGYYLAYRLIYWGTGEVLVTAVRAQRTAGLLEGVSVAVLNRLISLGIHAVFAVVLVLWFTLRRRPLLPSLGLMPMRRRLIPLCILCGSGATVTVGWLWNVIPFPTAWEEAYSEKAGTLFEDYGIWTFVLTVIVAPLMEEIVFRGLLFKRLREGMSFSAAALLSALAFGVAHASLLWMLYAFLLGFLLAWLTERTGSLWASVLCHFGFNLLGQVSISILPLPLYIIACVVGTVLLGLTLWDILQATKQQK